MTQHGKPDIKPDERAIFFPTIGRRAPLADAWQLPVHGWVFRPENDSLRRAAAVSLLRRWIGLEPDGPETSLFDRRLRAFLVDNQPDKVFTIRLGSELHTLPASTPDGHISGTIELASATADALLADVAASFAPSDAEQQLVFSAAPQPADGRSFSGRVYLVADEGLSVVSDIDDTIKVTHVKDRSALVRQTFLRPFEPVAGMAEVYRRWRGAGATFHYVSRSPWQLYLTLEEFLVENAFPAGTFHLRKFRWKDFDTLTSDRDGLKKLAEVEAILQWLPRRRFVLVGDSGQHDPEVYGELARRYGRQVQAVFIRNVSGEDRKDTRLQNAFAGVPAERWKLFDDPAELPDI